MLYLIKDQISRWLLDLLNDGTNKLLLVFSHLEGVVVVERCVRCDEK